MRAAGGVIFTLYILQFILGRITPFPFISMGQLTASWLRFSIFLSSDSRFLSSLYGTDNAFSFHFYGTASVFLLHFSWMWIFSQIREKLTIKGVFCCISTAQRKIFRNFHSLYENSIWKSPILDRFSDISGTKFSFFHIQRKISHSGRSDLRSWMWNLHILNVKKKTLNTANTKSVIDHRSL